MSALAEVPFGAADHADSLILNLARHSQGQMNINGDSRLTFAVCDEAIRASTSSGGVPNRDMMVLI